MHADDRTTKARRAQAPAPRLAPKPLRHHGWAESVVDGEHAVEVVAPEDSASRPVGPMVIPLGLGAAAVVLASVVLFISSLPSGYDGVIMPLAPSMTLWLLWFGVVGGTALSSLNSLGMARWARAQGGDPITEEPDEPDGHGSYALALRVSSVIGLVLGIASMALMAYSLM